MADLKEREQKLVQYLNEAYGKEKELETALQAHIGMTTRDAYKKRLQQHLKETKAHGRAVERRIKQLGGAPQGFQAIVGRATALAKGPVHMIRGSGEEEKLLKNAKTEYSEEAEEIATYTAIEALAEAVGDADTAKLARGIRREEQRMAGYLEKLIPQLTRAVAQSEIPAAQRIASRTRRRSSRSKASARSGSSRSKTSARSGSSRSKTSARSGSSRSGSARSGTSRSKASGGSGSRGTARRRSSS